MIHWSKLTHTFYITLILASALACGVAEEIDNKAQLLLETPPIPTPTFPHDNTPLEAMSIAPFSDQITNTLPRMDELNDLLLPTTLTTPNDPNQAIIPTKELTNAYTKGLQAIRAKQAWTLQSGNCKNIKIAVLDSSIDIEHSDLKENIFTNTNEIPGNGVDDDQNGFIDDIHGWNFVNGNANVKPSPLSSYLNSQRTISYMIQNGNLDLHGTHVTGIIGAKGNNNKYISGVCWDAQIIPIKMIDEDGIGSTSQALAAIDYATKMGAKIINASWSGAGFDLELYYKMRMSSSVLFIVASGNDAKNIDEINMTPGSFGRINYDDQNHGYSALDNLISVGASSAHLEDVSHALFSNYGNKSVHISAPGVSILSLIPEGYVLYLGNQINMWTENGTSMATPFVTGLAALISNQNASLTPFELKKKILSFSTRLQPLQGKIEQSRFLNLAHPLLERTESE